jgi:hypothetical protein
MSGEPRARNATDDAGAGRGLEVKPLFGPIHYRVLVTRQSVTHQFTDTVVSRYLDAKSVVGDCPSSVNFELA